MAGDLAADPAAELRRLIEIMAALRDPATGCPWDQAQDFDSIARYTIEEAYEVADAIAARDWAALPDELGDLLFQVVYHSRMAEEAGRFAFADVARAICDKMIRRHPHVFGETGARDAARRPSPGRRKRPPSAPPAPRPGRLPASRPACPP